MSRRVYSSQLLVAAISITMSALHVRAASNVSEWLNAASGNWTTAANWSTNPVFPQNGSPTVADQYDVLIDKTGAPYTVTLNADLTVSNVTIDSPA